MEAQDGEEPRGDEATVTTLLVATRPAVGMDSARAIELQKEGKGEGATTAPALVVRVVLFLCAIATLLLVSVGLCHLMEQQQWWPSLSPTLPLLDEVFHSAPPRLLPPLPPSTSCPTLQPSGPSFSVSDESQQRAVLLDHLNARLSAYRTFHPSWARLGSPIDLANATLVYNESQTLPPCGVLNGREQGRWALSPTNDWTFIPHECSLRRPTAHQARQCLSQQSLTFLGDSLLRYQYLSLISFLDFGEWPEPLDHLPGLPSLMIESEWPSWAAFFAAAGAAFGGHETCGGCQREQSVGHLERRHFHLPDSGITLRYLFVTRATSFQAGMLDVREEWLAKNRGSVSTPYRYLTDAHYNNPQPCVQSVALDCYYPANVPFHPPTALLANIGLWFSDRINQSELIPVFTAARDVDMGDIPMRRIWRMTTPGIGGEDVIAHDVEWAVFRDGVHQWEVLEVFNMTVQPYGVRGAYWDGRHFLPFVYQEINIWLLNTLCDEQWQWVTSNR